MNIKKIIALSALTIGMQAVSAPFGKQTGVTADDAMVEDKVNAITLEPKKISDSAGLVYVGGYVQERKLADYLAQMKSALGAEYVTFRAGQQKRDHNQFHITLVNPFEFKALSNDQQNWLLVNKKAISVNLVGLGRVKNDKGRAFFVVAESNEGQQLRRRLGLADKDFHVTLGFSPNEIGRAHV